MFCNNCGAANPLGSLFCSSCGTKVAGGQGVERQSPHSQVNLDFDAEHNAAWDLLESGIYDQAETIFRRLCDAGYEQAWASLGFVLRDTPINRSSSEYSNVAVKAFSSVRSNFDENEIAVVVGSVVLPLARYTLHAKLLEWASQEFPRETSWPELVSRTNQWISWIMSLTEQFEHIFESGVVDLDATINYYETLHHIGELVNEAGQLRAVLEGEEANTHLKSLARVGFSKFGRWE